MSAAAHHSYTEFDNAQSIEIKGSLLNVAWQNPHAHIEVQAAGPDGEPRDLGDEKSSGVNYLRRLQMPLEIFESGQPRKGRRLAIEALGHPFVWHEYPVGRRAGIRVVALEAAWADTAHGYVAGRSGTGDAGVATVASAATIFRVWTSVSSSSVRPDDPDASPQSLSRVPLPLTPAAQAAVAAFNPVEESTAPRCAPKGMP